MTKTLQLIKKMHIAIVFLKIEFVFKVTKIINVKIDSTSFFKIWKFKILSRFKIINIWKIAKNNAKLINKIKKTQIILIIKKLTIYIFVARWLFIKSFFKKQIIKLSIQSFRMTINKKNFDFWYFCASPRVWIFLKKQICIHVLFDFNVEINLMNANV